MGEERISDSVVVGDISFTNTIYLSADLIKSQNQRDLAGALDSYYSGEVQFTVGDGPTELISVLEKIYSQLLQDEENKRKYHYKDRVRWSLENDLRSLPHLRYGHQFDSRKQKLIAEYAGAGLHMYGGYCICELVGYDTANKWPILWIQEFRALKKSRSILQRLLKRGLHNKYDWYGEPIYSSNRFLCSMTADVFQEVYSTNPISIGLLSWQYFNNLERYVILEG